jgi:hypothetical protein
VISLGTLTQSGGGKEYLPQYPERQIEYVSPTDREKEAPGHRDGRTLYKLTSSESSDLGSLLRCRPNTCGWCLTSSGKNEFSKTKLAPKQTFPMMAHRLPSRYAFGVIGRKSMVATAPTAANVSSMVFRNWPWSAAPDIVTTTSAWRRTLMLNVYMAKLAVLISIPSKRKTHCPLVCFLPPLLYVEKVAAISGMSILVLQDRVGSLARTALADPRARSSRVIGMKAPRPQITKTSAAKE